MQTRVLLIDDYPLLLRSLERLLRRANCEVFKYERASLCERCRCSADRSCADIIISDVTMPGRTGIEFAENQRAKGCKIPFIALASGHWQPSDRDKAVDLGCRVFDKPFDTTQLLEWVDQCSRAISSDRILASFFRSWPGEAP